MQYWQACRFRPQILLSSIYIHWNTVTQDCFSVKSFVIIKNKDTQTKIQDTSYQRGFDLGRVQSCVLRLPKYWPPTPLSTRRVCPPPATEAGGTHSPGGEGGGGSIFWKTKEVGLASYNNNLSTHPTIIHPVQISRWASTLVSESSSWHYRSLFDQQLSQF